MKSEKELIDAGWEKRNTCDEPRLSELSDTYRELGFEVRREPFVPTDATHCTECMSSTPERFRTIWTRRPAEEE